MSKRLLLLFYYTAFFSLYSFAQSNDALNMVRLSGWQSPEAISYNDVWGYTTGEREYAILGSNWGTHFLDITDPAAPVHIHSEEGRNNNVIWRDFKVHGHYAYGVADNIGNSLQIFDLQYLPDSIVKVYDDTLVSRNCHNIHIENGRLYLSSNYRDNTYFPMEVFSLADPVAPVHLHSFTALPQIHDVFVRNDTAYLSAAEAGLYIYDYRDPSNPVLISSLSSYPFQGFNHSSWITADGQTVIFADENHGFPLKVVNISTLSSPTVTSFIQSNPGAMPHNPFIRGDKLYIAYYHDGVQIYNISNPAAPERIAFYDTYPDNVLGDYTGFNGCWGVYPFFASDNIIASDMTYGLFVLREQPGINVGAKDLDKLSGFRVYPNPSQGRFYIESDESHSSTELKLFDLAGKEVWSITLYGKIKQPIDISFLPGGMYLLKINGHQQQISKKILLGK